MAGTSLTTLAKLSLLAAMTAGLCPADSWFTGSAEAAATAKSVEGRVSVLRDLREWAVEVGGKVKVQETIVTGKDGHALFEVSDGSTFEVFPNAKVVFRKNAGNWRDLLDVMLGRVRVQIEHLGKEPNPNRVLTPTAVISVRGTIFDINVEDDDESTLVEVEEGIVDVRHALLGSQNVRTLTAGESIRVYRNEPIARRFDKGNLIKNTIRIGMQAASVALRPGGAPGLGKIGGGGSVGGVGGVGDTGGSTQTPAPPSTPPAAPLPAPPPAGGLPSLP
jgi:hypothetical protein